MTAFAVSFDRERLVVCGDTLGYIPDRIDPKPVGFMSKIIPIPHLRAVLFSFGQYQLCVEAAAAVMMAANALTIEAAAAALPAFLREASARYAAQHGIADYTKVQLLELCFGGYSATERRMRLWQMSSAKEYQLLGDQGRYGHVAPMPSLPPERVPARGNFTVEQHLVEIVKTAREVFKELRGFNCVGGEIISCDVSPSGINQQVLYRFPDYEQSLHASAAISRRIERGGLRVDVGEALFRTDEVVELDPRHQKPATPSAQPVSRQQRRAAERAATKRKAA